MFQNMNFMPQRLMGGKVFEVSWLSRMNIKTFFKYREIYEFWKYGLRPEKTSG